jgi:ribosomal protein S20
VPRIRSAKKRSRQTKVITARNRTQRSKLRTAVKKVRQAPDAETRAAAFK